MITDTVKPNHHEEIHTDGPDQDGTETQQTDLPLLLAELWKPLIHPTDDRIFVTDKGERFEVPTSQMRWEKPLGKKVILIDTDTRLNTTEENTILDKRPLHFPTLHGRTGGHLNHYLYAMIHGYDYRLVRAADYPDRHGTWVKPAIAKEALKTHDFVISLDSDAVFTHLNLPIEWLMNLWDIRPEETLVAMAYDLDIKIDYDPRGNLVLNTGFVISQASQRTQEMYERWEDCPRSIPGCEHWNFKWAHEQSAFSHYIRYEFNRTHDVKNIPCSHANGNEFTAEGQCKCQGIFIRCTLLIPDHLKEGVWGCIPSVATDDKSVFVNLTEKGIRLSFPRDTDRSVWAWYSPDLEMTASTLHHITIELLGSSTDVSELTDNEAKAFESFVSRDEVEDFRILTLTRALDKACCPRVIGFGTPFHGVNTTVDGYVNQDHQICGVASLSEILQRKDFTLLAKETQIDPFILNLEAPRTPQTFGYGEVHTWDMTRSPSIGAQPVAPFMETPLPSIDLFSGIPTDVRDACLNQVFEDDKERVQQYFGKLYLGLGLVSGPPGTGKSHLASIVVTLLCFNKSIKKVYVAAASNGATDNIAERINTMAQMITGTLLRSDVKQLMVLRGYSLSIEVENCTLALLGKPFKDDVIWNPSPWKFSRSLCWWTLRALGSETVPQLDADNNIELRDLHQRLSSIAAPSSNDPEFSNFRQLVRLAKGLESPFDYERIVTHGSHKKTLIQLMELVVGCADVIATTPATSTSPIYRSFNDEKARAVVFDEAATMFCSDGLLVYGNTPRPMVAIGDPKQLAPNLTTAFELLRGNQRKHDRRNNKRPPVSDRVPTNRFAQFAKISWLSWFIHLGWPVFHLYTQHRMAEGLFDLSLNSVYRTLVPHFKYSPLCHPNNFSLGPKVEEYLKTEYRLQPSPENTLQPVFFNCVNCPCRGYPDNLSRLNPRRADVIAKFLVKMIRELKLPTEDIVVLTPYRANIGAIGRRFRKEPELEGVEFTTFNRFQGREAQIVVLSLCVNEETGPLFVAEERSLNVALTRQRSSLLIFGDIDTRAKPHKYYDTAQNVDKEESRINPHVFEHVFGMIGASGRIVRMEGDEKVDPDSRWASKNWD
ncbi:hypothetical protein FCULG_00012064 [Fusarium culmorum]|uniref:DNA2/NAM7 helicase-like C-terminal domain-containing protein n=1 Tax=Fusarium culmorum TaxID=5516 RepID=A0A2T4GG29_FUSCU|nr:hypothetical protein FCULG_00012064 [Fusarium culmorum]